MKRKIFTWLVAFLALAAFQANAQISGTGAPAILNVGGYYAGDDYANSQREVYPAPYYVNNPAAQDSFDVVDYPSGLKKWSGHLSTQNGKTVYVPQKGGGQIGSMDDYFTIEPESNSGSSGQSRIYHFWTYAPDGTGRVKKEVVIDGFNRFETVRFSEYSANASFTVQAQYADQGGYLCVPGSMAAANSGREMVVVDLRDNSLHVVSFEVYKNHRIDTNGPGGEGDWPLITPPNNTHYYSAVWIKANGVTGRWARYGDFQSIQDFIQIKSTEGPLFQAKGTDGAMYDKFKVALTGVYTEWDQTSADHNFSFKPSYDPTWMDGSPTKDSSVTDQNGFIQLFTLISPENGNNVVTAAKGQNVFTTQSTYDDNAYGTRLLLLPPVMRDIDTSATVTGCSQDTATQQFAIWIESDGSMGLYPLGAYDYKFGEDANHQPLNPQFRINNSIIYNAPRIKSGYQIDAGNPENKWANYAYRVSFAENEYVVGPSTLDQQTAFSRQKYFFLDVTKYNAIDEKRYFYLESTVPGRDGKPLVVDVVKENINGEIFKKIVLTDREVNRFVKDGTDTTYYNTPYDSLNMSACWSVRKVYNTNYDNTISAADKMIIGYVFVNEEGDTLQYAAFDSIGATWGGDPINPALYSDSITNALLKYEPAVYGAGAVDHSYVWKTLGFENQTDDYFFLMNMNGAVYKDGNMIKTPRSMRPVWDIRIDTVRTWWSTTSCYSGYFPFDTAIISDNYFKSGTVFTSGSLITSDAERATYYNDPVTYKGFAFNGLDSSIHRNIGAYVYDTVPKTFYNFNATRMERYPFHRLENSFGLELRLAPIHVNMDTTLAPHDSIYAGASQYEWDRYRVDSLWTYLNKVPGNYAIKEALGWSDIMRISGYDPSLAGNTVFMGLPTASKSVMGIMPVDSAVIHDSLSGIDSHSATGVGAGDPSHNTHSYKWYNIYYVDGASGDTLYMVFDNVRHLLTPSEQQYGFSFKPIAKKGAGKFRFYQPIVADKEQEYFIIETQVPEYEYSGANLPTLNNFKDKNGVALAGKPMFALLSKDSREITVTADPAIATRWDFIPYAFGCRIDYIDNNFLADTKMYGAPLLAQRYYTRDTHNGYTNTYISNNGGSGMYNSPDAATEDSLKYAVTFTLVPAKVIEAHKYPSSNKYYGGINGYYGDNNASAIGSHFEFGDQTRDVQLYYVRQITRSAAGSDTTFLTVTNQNVFYQSLQQQKDPSVSGEVLKFLEYNKYNKVNVGGNLYENDSTLLQMFAVYGKLGTDADRQKEKEDGTLDWNIDCITPAEFEFNFGQFIFVPAASHIYDYKAGEAVSLSRNHKIGNDDIYDEYRVGAYTDYSKYENQLIVVPSEASHTPGVTASEYIFSYQIYKDQFACPNFVDNVNQHSVASDGMAVYDHDYADPSSQWTLTRNDIEGDLRYKYYTFAPVANKKRNQAPIAKQTMLTDEYYIYMINDTLDKTAYGVDGYVRTIHAVKKFERNAQNEYVFDTIFDNDVKYLVVDQITNQYVGNTDKISGTGANRRYNGDSTIDYFYKFSSEDLYGADWKILESVYAERYMWSRDFENAIAGLREAYVQDVTPNRQAEYLKIIPSITDTMGYCNGVPLHTIPYYNIVYVNSTGEKYYLQMLQDGTLRFEWLNIQQEEDLADLSKHDYRPDLKFCFPYKLRATANADMIEYQSDSLDAMYYNYKKVFIQSMVGPNAAKPGLVKVEAKSSLLKGSIQPDLYTIDYTKSEVELDATTWIFGDNATSNEVWIRLQDVPGDASGWLRDAQRIEGSDYFVIKTTEPTADNVNYAQLNHRTDVVNLYGDIDAAKLTFEFVDSTLLPGYDPKRVWYYRIKNGDGEYLTSAGYHANDTVTPKPGDSLIYKPNTPGAEGYAYFADKEITNDTYYRQLFGLKYIKREDTSKPDPYAFWVVAGVDSTKSNTKTSNYYYLAGKDNLMTYRYGGGTSRQDTEDSALRFLFGQADEDGFTDIDNVDANNGVVIYGVEGGVTIQNATGVAELYTIDGRLLKSVDVTDAVQTIPAPKGVVIVKNNTAVVKVVVR